MRQICEEVIKNEYIWRLTWIKEKGKLMRTSGGEKGK